MAVPLMVAALRAAAAAFGKGRRRSEEQRKVGEVLGGSQ